MSYKKHFSRALEAHPGRLHFAAHSHHLWPDVTADAQAAAWQLAAREADLKWDHVFGEVLPRAQRHISKRLNTTDPAAIALAPNLHEFIVRLMSTFDPGRPVRILTTDSEFHSFTRQAARLAEEGRVEVTRVPTEPFDTFSPRLLKAAGERDHDLVYISHVFYNSGFVFDAIDALVDAVPPSTTVFIDGYHAFMAMPIDLSRVQSYVFYGAGGYKYAMSGEGVCFLHCPPGFAERPVNTGWFAAFGHLTDAEPDRVPYAADGFRMMGATLDPTPHFRLNAVMELWDSLEVSVSDIHRHVRDLQDTYLRLADDAGLVKMSRTNLIPQSARERGNFLTFRLDDAGDVHEKLRAADVVSDFRGDRLRIGFGIYHDPDDVAALVSRGM
jgi:selenocysteine lyase/cysteine desulfurase